MLSVVRKSLREINSGLKRALATFGGIEAFHIRLVRCLGWVNA